MVLGALAALASAMGCTWVSGLDELSAIPSRVIDGGASSVNDAPPTPAAPQAPPPDDGGNGLIDASVDARTKYHFFDDFERASTASGIGNDWIAKQPGFRILDGRASRVKEPGVVADFRNHITYRPVREAVGDVSIPVDVHFSSPPNPAPQIDARVQTDSLATIGVLDSYLFTSRL